MTPRHIHSCTGTLSKNRSFSALKSMPLIIYRKSLAERLEAQEELNIKGDKGNMGNKELTFTFNRVSRIIVQNKISNKSLLELLVHFSL